MDKKAYYEVSRDIKSICDVIINEELNKNSSDEQFNDSIMEESDNICVINDEVNRSSENILDQNIKYEQFNIREDIASWCVQFQISEAAGNGLLKCWRKYHPELPQNIKTLKKTPNEVSGEIVELAGGKYLHNGLRKNVEKFLAVYKIKEVVLKIDIGVDGIPLTKSSNSQLWPILGNIVPYKEVFIIGVFHGNKKPICADAFLKQFLDEMRSLEMNPIMHQGSRIKIDIRAFICDAPARSFILGRFYRIKLFFWISFRIRYLQTCINILVYVFNIYSHF